MFLTNRYILAFPPSPSFLLFFPPPSPLPRFGETSANILKNSLSSVMSLKLKNTDGKKEQK